jgi:PhzF family phenazine biosynthesis protein
LIESLGADPVYVGKTRFDYLLEAASEETVRKMRPDFDLLEKVPCRGVIVTAKGTDCDFVSRFFAPAVGIREDPVTGSAHCSLAPYWKGRLGRDSFNARQVSARGGALKVRAEAGRTYISGQAVTVLEGRLVHRGEWSGV